MSNNTIIALGAEAKIYKDVFFGEEVIVKHRIEKKYRHKQIDNLLRKNRSLQEVRLLSQAMQIGVNVPYVLDFDKSDWKITLEYINGSQLKSVIHNIDNSKIFNQIGKYMGLLHNSNIIHGDLTTSNILLLKDKIYFIDFGLGYISTQIEDKAVDILVLKHTLVSSHHKYLEIGLNSFYEGYISTYTNAKSVIKRIKTVESRIRYH